MNFHIYHQALLEKREDLIRALASREDIHIDGKLPDRLDEALASSARTLAVDAVNRNHKLLKEVQHALQRLNSIGEHTPYGLCETCEETVAPERLKTVPWARLCINCQIELEQQKMSA